MPEIKLLPEHGELLLEFGNFRSWFRKEKRKGAWPSQLEIPIGKRLGRRSKQDAIRPDVIRAVDDGRWRARLGIPALAKLVAENGRSCSEDTLLRVVKQLFKETGRAEFRVEPRFRSAAK
jgi:hypothetical protein